MTFLGQPGHLLTITSQAENKQVIERLLADSDLWIGLSDIAVEDEFVWVTGEPFSCEVWGVGEPNNFGGNEDAVIVQAGRDGYWSDFDEAANLGYVVEYDLPLTPVEWKVSEGGNGNHYLAIEEPTNWEEARAIAESMLYLGAPGHLVTLTSQAENDFVSTTFQQNGSDNFSIGLNDIDSEGNFVWVTGEPLDYQNWGPAEPNGSTGENGVIMWQPWAGEWADYRLDLADFGYIVEFETGKLQLDGFEGASPPRCTPVP